jgi:5'-methylthioadenosine phosphorylase
MPSEINYRANIFGFKTLGVEFILSASAVGSLKEQYRPLDILIPDQFFDRTKGRISTFFGRGLVAHVGFAHPFCPVLSDLAYSAAVQAGLTPGTRAPGDAGPDAPTAPVDDAGLKVERRTAGTGGAHVHKGGAYVCMEGPQFSTLAESQLYRSWGMDIIGMTNLQEAKLAREAEIAYATLALVTDYDCWHEDHDAVSIDMVVEYLTKNVRNAQLVLKEAVRRVASKETPNPFEGATRSAIFTASEHWNPETAKKLDAIIGKYATK